MGSATPGPPPLTGFTVGVTADRRRDELAALLHRRGAEVVVAPAMRIVPLADDALLREATAACVTGGLDYVVATTGVGWRAWISAAEDWGLGEPLLAACREAVLISRGPKATGALRACGLHEGYAPDSEALDEVLAWLLARDLRGRRIAVQEHGASLTEFAAALRHQGASVMEVPVYRWGPPEDRAAVRRLAERTVRREVHALPFTSAPAIEAFLASCDREELLAALRHDVLPACIGPVCARPLLAAGVPCVWPERGRLGSLVRTLTRELIRRHRRELATPAGPLILQGNAVLTPDAVLRLPPVPAAVLAALADRPGTVLSRAELLHRAWPDPSRRRPDEHAVEAAVGRLRTALGPYGHLVGTVTKRGYRLLAGGG